MNLLRSELCRHFWIVGLCFLFTGLAFGADPEPFPGQPNINTALKQLGIAQDEVKSNRDLATAKSALLVAKNYLETSSNNKGSFRSTAIRMTAQALKHLEKKEFDKTAHDIDEAIEAVNKAGAAGAK